MIFVSRCNMIRTHREFRHFFYLTSLGWEVSECNNCKGYNKKNKRKSARCLPQPKKEGSDTSRVDIFLYTFQYVVYATDIYGKAVALATEEHRNDRSGLRSPR